jgi:hypothetical protein
MSVWRRMSTNLGHQRPHALLPGGRELDVMLSGLLRHPVPSTEGETFHAQ